MVCGVSSVRTRSGDGRTCRDVVVSNAGTALRVVCEALEAVALPASSPYPSPSSSSSSRSLKSKPSRASEGIRPGSRCPVVRELSESRVLKLKCLSSTAVMKKGCCASNGVAFAGVSVEIGESATASSSSPFAASRTERTVPPSSLEEGITSSSCKKKTSAR